MKILFFSTYFYPYISGLTIYPWRILNHLSKKHKITVLTFNHSKDLLKTKNYKLRTLYLPYLFRLSKGFISPQSIIYFIREVKNNDLVILNLPNFEGLLLAIFARLLKKRIVSVVHCQVFLPKTLINSVVNFFLNCSFYLQLWLSDIVLPTTQDYANSLLFGRLFKNKIRPIFPPIKPLPILPHCINTMKQQKGKDVWIGYVGRIAREKGIEYLVHSFNPPAGQAGRLNNIRLVFAAPTDTVGESNYLKEIKDLLRINNINHLFLGQLTLEQLCSFYKTIDLLVLPSVNQTEAFGMVQVEAMLSGTPVIASNLPGIRIPIKLTKMGLLVEPRNSKQLAEAIIAILKKKNKFANADLLEKAKKIFDVKKTYRFYDDLLSHIEPKYTAAV